MVRCYLVFYPRASKIERDPGLISKSRMSISETTEYTAIKDAIECFTDLEVGKMDFVEKPMIADEFFTGTKYQHITECDGDASWSDDCDEGELFIVFVCRKNIATLLRSVGTKNRNGVPYVGAGWLPENAFGGSLWSEEEKLRMLRKRYYEVNKQFDRVFYVSVFYKADE